MDDTYLQDRLHDLYEMRAQLIDSGGGLVGGKGTVRGAKKNPWSKMTGPQRQKYQDMKASGATPAKLKAYMKKAAAVKSKPRAKSTKKATKKKTATRAKSRAKSTKKPKARQVRNMGINPLDSYSFQGLKDECEHYGGVPKFTCSGLPKRRTLRNLVMKKLKDEEDYEMLA